jgi:hypothetical protein
MGVPLKTENEEYAGKTIQIRGSEGGRRGFTGSSRRHLAGMFLGSFPPASPVA